MKDIRGGFNDLGWSLPTNQMNKQEEEQEEDKDTKLHMDGWMRGLELFTHV